MRKHLRDYLRIRNRYLLVVDLFMMGVSASIAMELRLESLDAILPFIVPLAAYFVLTTAVRVAAFIHAGLYKEFWPYASTQELKTLIRAGAYSTGATLLLFFAILLPLGLIPAGFPRSIPFIDSILTFIFIGGLRLVIRLGTTHDVADPRTKNLKPVVVVGAGVAGSLIVRELKTNPSLGFHPVAYLDDNPRKIMARIHGVQVLGSLNDLPRICKEVKAAHVVIAMPNAPGKVIRGVLQSARANGIEAKTVPGLFEILSGSARVVQLRDIRLEDLLRRGTVNTDIAAVSTRLRGKRILITGAGGSIGSELCRQIKALGPAEMILLGHGENSIFNISAELRHVPSPLVTIRPVIADIRGHHRLEQVFRRYRPEIVFHTAAHKHVPLMEDNAADAVTNNILGTLNVASLSADHHVERFVLVSTDKAVNPTSIMGATKRVAEQIVHEIAHRTGREFVIVRFGNVLGSRGSVVPVLQDQIESGGPVTITHEEVRRYFMTIPEAVQLVLQAGVMGTGGEVFVLDMGEQIRIADLARDLIRLSGYQEGRDVDIVYTGLRPGEKMEEELTLSSESFEPTTHDKIRSFRWNGVPANGHTDAEGQAAFRTILMKLLECAQAGNEECIEDLLREAVPEFQRPGTEKNVPLHKENGDSSADAPTKGASGGILGPFEFGHYPSLGASPGTLDPKRVSG